MQAAVRLKETLVWRAAVRPESLVCAECQKDCGAHYLHPVGFDKQEQPVLYSCISLSTDKQLASNRDHMIMCGAAVSCADPAR